MTRAPSWRNVTNFLSEVESKLRRNACLRWIFVFRSAGRCVCRRYVYLFASILLNGGSIRLWTTARGLHRSLQSVCCWKSPFSERILIEEQTGDPFMPLIFTPNHRSISTEIVTNALSTTFYWCERTSIFPDLLILVWLNDGHLDSFRVSFRIYWLRDWLIDWLHGYLYITFFFPGCIYHQHMQDFTPLCYQLTTSHKPKGFSMKNEIST